MQLKAHAQRLRQTHGRRHPLHSCAAAPAASPPAASLISQEELRELALARGLTLALSTLGPFFKASVTLRSAPGSEPVGVLEGFVAPPPFGILHLDSVRIYNSRLYGEARSEAQSPFGLAVLLGAAVFAHGHACGCSRAELLAINDSNAYAQRLVIYYRRLGFEAIREIGDGGLGDLPHLLVWGGAGMLMAGQVEPMLRRWTRALRRG
jgi:hypothetical protein